MRVCGLQQRAVTAARDGEAVALDGHAVDATRRSNGICRSARRGTRVPRGTSRHGCGEGVQAKITQVDWPLPWVFSIV